MDEEIYTREPPKESSHRSGGRRVEPENVTSEKAHSDKLKNEATAGESYRKKLRHGKKDNRMTKEEAKKARQRKKQGRAKIYKDAAIAAKARQTVIQNEDNNSGTDSLNAGLATAEVVTRRLQSETEKVGEAIRANQNPDSVLKTEKAKKSSYSEKLHNKTHLQEATSGARGAKEAKMAGEGADATKQVQKKLMQREFIEAAHKKQAAEAANGVGSVTKRFTDKAEDLMGRAAEAIREFIQEHPEILLYAAVILIVVLVISGALSSCSMMAGGVNHVSISTSYTADDPQIIAADEDYCEKEDDLQEALDNIETDYPGYDEYNYNLAEIGHNPYELAALLTVLYEDYTASEVQTMLQTIFDKQYELTIEEEVEIRTRTVTRTDPETGEEYEDEEEYEYYILNVTLINHSIEGIIDDMGLSADQRARYDLLMETFGNKRYLFSDSEYALPRYSPVEDYDVPAEYLTDVQFGNMLHEAEKYLGYPYVWGGSNPSTSFDCSGFVSYVINHCGNGWNVGRLTANGLYNRTQHVSSSEAKPGDLIFFWHTYSGAGNGASHVGIYVGDGMMLHCGNPIKYTSINSSYWQSHFLGYGRINE